MRVAVGLCRVAFAALVCFALGRASLGDDEPKSVEILTPKAGDLVDHIDEVMINVSGGEPVVLVRDNTPGSQWWVQQRAQVLNRTRYVALARFGNDKTPLGTEFQLIAVLIKDLKQFELCPPGAALEELPEELVRSEAVIVILQPKPAKVSEKDVISEPRDGSPVGRMSILTGRRATKGWPVVLVRPAEAGAEWWVQDPVQMTDDDHFRGVVRFGNQRTPNGTRFQILFLVTENPTPFKPGQALIKLPADVIQSPTIEVELQNRR